MAFVPMVALFAWGVRSSGGLLVGHPSASNGEYTCISVDGGWDPPERTESSMDSDGEHRRVVCGADLRRIEPGDCAAVAELHCAEFPGFFLTSLGTRVLREYYAEIAAQGHLGFVGRDANAVSGFVAGYVRSAGFYRSLVRNRWFRLSLATLPSAVRSPRVGLTIVRKLLARDAADVADGRCAWLSSIAVRADRRRTGLGRRLVRVFVEDARSMGLLEVGLETDATANEHANGFYRDAGFRLARSFCDVNGRRMNEYRLDCRRGPAGS